MAKRKNKAAEREKRRQIRVILTAAVVTVIAVYLIISYINGRTPLPEVEGTLTVRYIDVGQGDAILISAPDGTDMLIDAGPGSSESKLVSYLSGCSTGPIEYFLVTHFDEDHIGGADMIFENFTVSNFITYDHTKDTGTVQTMMKAASEETGCNMIHTTAGDSYKIGDATFSILAPLTDKNSVENNYSIVGKLVFGNTSFMFTGDAEAKSEALICEQYSPSELKCDVLKLGHHGSRTSSSDDFLNAVAPEYGVISCGKDNKYGHPNTETITKLENRSITYFRTDETGSIVIRSDGTKIYTPN